jgi:hypothetical protein
MRTGPLNLSSPPPRTTRSRHTEKLARPDVSTIILVNQTDHRSEVFQAITKQHDNVVVCTGASCELKKALLGESALFHGKAVYIASNILTLVTKETLSILGCGTRTTVSEAATRLEQTISTWSATVVRNEVTDSRKSVYLTLLERGGVATGSALSVFVTNPLLEENIAAHFGKETMSLFFKGDYTCGGTCVLPLEGTPKQIARKLHDMDKRFLGLATGSGVLQLSATTGAEYDCYFVGLTLSSIHRRKNTVACSAVQQALVKQFVLRNIARIFENTRQQDGDFLRVDVMLIDNQPFVMELVNSTIVYTTIIIISPPLRPVTALISSPAIRKP